ncbi:toxin-antitoxin system YwqK family antitoxin, partial [Flavobacterium chungangense]
NNTSVDFENFKSEIVVPLDTKSKFDYIVYQFPLTGEPNNKDYFEISFILKNNFSKIFSTNVVRIDKMPDITVKYGAEYEKIPKVGEVVTEKNSKTGFIEKIKYRDFNNLIIIEFNEKQVKISESNFLLKNLKFKKITEFYENGNISLIASYDNGIVIGEFKSFYENGNPEKSGLYLEDLKKDKTWNYYNVDGAIVEIEKYQNGKLVDQ